jgi:hypothetical protein
MDRILPEMKVLTHLKNGNWNTSLDDLMRKLQALRDLVMQMEMTEENEKICKEAVLPLMLHIGTVCESITIIDNEHLALDYNPKSIEQTMKKVVTEALLEAMKGKKTPKPNPKDN